MGAECCKQQLAVHPSGICPDVKATIPPEIQVSAKAKEFFDNVSGFVAAKNEIDALAGRGGSRRRGWLGSWF